MYIYHWPNSKPVNNAVLEQFEPVITRLEHSYKKPFTVINS